MGAFGFSFLILINIWNRYTTTASVLPVESVLMVRLNMLLLFFVAVEPYLFNLLIIQGSVSAPLGQYVSAYYALDIGGMNFVLAYFAHILTKHKGSRIPSDAKAGFRRGRDVSLVVASMFVISALPFFWTVAFFGLEWRFLLWILTIPAIRIAHYLGLS